jgi:hypothetical protein
MGWFLILLAILIVVSFAVCSPHIGVRAGRSSDSSTPTGTPSAGAAEHGAASAVAETGHRPARSRRPHH